MDEIQPPFFEGPDAPALAGVNHLSPFQIELVHAYSESGNAAEIARKFGLTHKVLEGFMGQLWWEEELAAIRRTKTALLDIKLSNLINKSLERIEKAFEEGEEMVDGLGQSHMLPVKAIDASRIFVAVFDRRQLVRQLPTSIVKDEGKLGELAEKLERLTRLQQMKTIEEDTGRRTEETPEARRKKAMENPKLQHLIEAARAGGSHSQPQEGKKKEDKDGRE